MVYVLLAVHIFFCFKTKFVQRHTLKGIRYSLFGGGRGNYAAFAQALGTTVGPGNIVGVAVAISAGGAGSVFWMWLCGILAMPTKYAESYLSLKYRDGGIGGPMVLLSRFGYKKTACVWTVLCMSAGLLMGAAVPSSSLASFLPCPQWVSGLLLAAAVTLAISRGVGGISRICSLVVPVMSVGFILLCVITLFSDTRAFSDAVSRILADAFLPRSALGGGLGLAVKSGVARGLYSNEAGLGSGGVLAADSGDDNTVLSSLGAMTTCFWDTVVMCALTGIVFVAGGTQLGSQPDLAVLSSFSAVPYSRVFLSLSMSFFVYATVIGWYGVAVRAVKYTFGSYTVYSFLFVIFVVLGALSRSDALWKSADTVNLLMLAPSLFIFVKLSDKISLHIK